jgi:hypothetical protein
MKRVEKKVPEFEECYEAVLAGIVGNQQLSAKLTAVKSTLEGLACDYEGKANFSQLHEIDAIQSEERQPVSGETLLVGGIKKCEYVNLYNYYLRDKAKVEGRKIYDRIKILTNLNCPFCGGIGYVENVDHFLPKSYFPLYSIVPYNLIPICRDCNMGEKGASYVTAENKQLIHPYGDQNCFFEDRWVKAEIVSNQPLIISYSALPPETWSSINKDRAVSHFESLNLEKRYGRLGATEGYEVIELFKRSLKKLNAEKKREYLLDRMNVVTEVNHWKYALYEALAASELPELYS